MSKSKERRAKKIAAKNKATYERQLKFMPNNPVRPIQSAVSMGVRRAIAESKQRS